MRFTSFRRRRTLRRTRLSWFGNEENPSTIENSYLLLRSRSKVHVETKGQSVRSTSAEILTRAERAARRTH